MKKKYLPFTESRKVVKELGLKSQKEYRAWWRQNKPKDLPSNAPREYKKQGWTSWGDFLGSGFVSHQFRSYKPFEAAKKIVNTLGLKSQKEYTDWWRKNKPADLPSQPQKTYKNQGWTSWGDFLGSGFVATQFRQFKSFEEARKVVRKLGLRALTEYREWWKKNKPTDLPASPPGAYKNKGWTSWGDFLGTGFVGSIPKSKQYISFEEAREFVRKLGIKTNNEYVKLHQQGRIPRYIPRQPHRFYKKQGSWTSWGDFLATGFVFAKYRQFKPFEEAKEFVRKLGLKSLSDYNNWWKKNRPKDLPANANTVYTDMGWTSWGDFLGTGSVASFLKKFKSFEEARKYVSGLKLSGKGAYSKWAKSKERPSDIPASPPITFKSKGWTNWGDFLGTGMVAPQLREFKSFKDAKLFFRKLAKEYGIKNKKDWKNFVKNHELPDDIPALPWQVYSKQSILRRIKNK